MWFTEQKIDPYRKVTLNIVWRSEISLFLESFVPFAVSFVAVLCSGVKRVFWLILTAEANQNDLGEKIFEYHVTVSRPTVETSCGILTQNMAVKEDE